MPVQPLSTKKLLTVKLYIGFVPVTPQQEVVLLNEVCSPANVYAQRSHRADGPDTCVHGLARCGEPSADTRE